MHDSYHHMISSHELADFDLNLLRVLDVLLRVRSVTRAARELGLTQPAISRSLQRLRGHFGDPLLVRDGRHMEPTAVALQLRAPVGRLLQDTRQLFTTSAGFQPETAHWTVRIALADYPEHVLLPALALRLQREAPLVDLQLLTTLGHNPDPLIQGRIDLAIEPTGLLDGPDLVSRKLFDDELCCAVRRGHPLENKRLTIKRFAELEHVFVAPTGTPGGLVDRLLAERGLRRRLRAQVSTFTSPMPLIVHTDCIVTLPRRIASQLQTRWQISLLPFPFVVEQVSMSAYWHAGQHANPAHRWFRQLLHDTALHPPPRPSPVARASSRSRRR